MRFWGLEGSKPESRGAPFLSLLPPSRVQNATLTPSKSDVFWTIGHPRARKRQGKWAFSARLLPSAIKEAHLPLDFFLKSLDLAVKYLDLLHEVVHSVPRSHHCAGCPRVVPFVPSRPTISGR